MNAGRTRRFVSILACFLFVCVPSLALAESSETIVIRAGELHVGNGEVISHGMVIVRDGLITAVGTDLNVPSGATVIELADGSVTPGLIDANAAVESKNLLTPGLRNSRLIKHAPHKLSARETLHDLFNPHQQHTGFTGCCGSTCSMAMQHVSGKECKECGFPDLAPPMVVGTRRGVSLAEQSSEVIPHTRVIDSVNLRSHDFDRLLAGGVTTVFVAPDSAAVISSRGAVLRTGGPIAKRIVREMGAVKATIGMEPSRRGARNALPFRSNVTFHSRRPTTRMGVAWVFRKAFYDTLRRREGLEVYGADTPSESAMVVLDDVLKGAIPLRIQARKQHDIASAHRLASEFGLSFILEEAAEAYRCLPQLKASSTPVIFGPIYMNAPGDRRYTDEVRKSRLHTMKALLDEGIETALTAHELRGQDGLARQAMYAVRYGVSPQQALAAVTSTPAKMLGIADRVGTVAKGKQADLVVWSGQPFDAVSYPLVVLIDGEIVLDRRGG